MAEHVTINVSTLQFGLPDLAGRGGEVTDMESRSGKVLATLLEAAECRRGPHGAQPWRWTWARRGTVEFDRLTELLPAQPHWAADATAFALLASSRLLRKTHRASAVFSAARSFDAESAWLGFALRTRIAGVYTRETPGLDWERAEREFGVPADFSAEAAVAIGPRPRRRGKRTGSEAATPN